MSRDRRLQSPVSAAVSSTRHQEMQRSVSPTNSIVSIQDRQMNDSPIPVYPSPVPAREDRNLPSNLSPVNQPTDDQGQCVDPDVSTNDQQNDDQSPSNQEEAEVRVTPAESIGEQQGASPPRGDGLLPIPDGLQPISDDPNNQKGASPPRGDGLLPIPDGLLPIPAGPSNQPAREESLSVFSRARSLQQDGRPPRRGGRGTITNERGQGSFYIHVRGRGASAYQDRGRGALAYQDRGRGRGQPGRSTSPVGFAQFADSTQFFRGRGNMATAQHQVRAK